jgi:hypothetical protein
MLHDRFLRRTIQSPALLVPKILPITTLHHRLGLALQAALGDGWTVVQSQMRDWASATFVGARHSYDLRIALADEHAPQDTYSDSLNALCDQDFDMSGHLVADLTVAHLITIHEDGLCWLSATIEVLTVEGD